MSVTRPCGLLLAALVLVVLPAQSSAQLDILSGKPLGSLAGGQQGETPESVVSVRAEFTAADGTGNATLSVTAEISPPWHAYSTTQKAVLATPTELTVDPGKGYQLVGEFRATLPPTIVETEGMTFETYAPEVTWQAPVEIAPGTDLASLKISGSARIQVCKEGTCLAPTQFPFTAMLAQPAGGGGGGGGSGQPVGFYAHPNIHAKILGRLEPQVATPGSVVNLVLSAEMPKDWHVYEVANRDTGDLGYKPTLIVMTSTSGFPFSVTKASAKADVVASEIPGQGPQRFHDHEITWTTAISVPKGTRPGKYPVSGIIGYQTCQSIQCDAPRAARFEGLLTVGEREMKGGMPLTFSDAKYAEAAKLAAARPPEKPSSGSSPVQPASGRSSLPMIIGFSLLGGLILNFMPCVLPVIGLKILSFAEQAGRSRKQILALNLWYSLGLLTVFVALATLASAANLGLREENLGWGEQFHFHHVQRDHGGGGVCLRPQLSRRVGNSHPRLRGLGARGQCSRAQGRGWCVFQGHADHAAGHAVQRTALGPVFAYTLKQPPAITYLIFTCIGLGMASPYLVIGAAPRLIRFLPKPGAWMDTFKQIMGFVMLGTIVYLFTFINRDYLVPTFAMMVGLWAGCWWIGRTSLVETLGRKAKAWMQGAVFAAIVAWLSFTWLAPHASVIPWQTFSPSQLTQLTSEGKTVMVEFTANWCLTCKLNLYTAIETSEVKELIAANQVVPLLADWTDGSPEIKKALESLDSASIPLLAVFPADGRAPLILRDVISKQELLETLKKAGPSKSGAKSLTAAMP